MLQYSHQPASSSVGASDLLFVQNQLQTCLCQQFIIGSNLYEFYSATTELTGNIGAIFKSQDYGKTWVVLDEANSPPNAITGFFDGLKLIAVGTTDFDTQIVAFYDFDFTTETWGTKYADTGSPEPGSPGGSTGAMALQLRSDGTFVLIYHGPDFVRTFLMGIYDANSDTWTIDIEVGVNAEALPGYADAAPFWANQFSTTIYQDNIYLFFHTSGESGTPDPAWNNRWFYQRIRPDNSVHAGNDFYDFPGNDVDLGDMSDSNNVGLPSIATFNGTDFLVWPIERHDTAQFPDNFTCYQSVFAGTGVLPEIDTWTERISPIDPAYFGDRVNVICRFSSTNGGGFSVTKNGDLYIVYDSDANVFDNSIGDFNTIRLCQCQITSLNPNDWTFTGTTVTDYTMAPFNQYDFSTGEALITAPVITIAVNFLQINTQFSYTAIDPSIFDIFWMGNFGPSSIYYPTLPPGIQLPFECCLDPYMGCILRR